MVIFMQLGWDLDNERLRFDGGQVWSTWSKRNSLSTIPYLKTEEKRNLVENDTTFILFFTRQTFVRSSLHKITFPWKAAKKKTHTHIPSPDPSKRKRFLSSFFISCCCFFFCRRRLFEVSFEFSFFFLWSCNFQSFFLDLVSKPFVDFLRWDFTQDAFWFLISVFLSSNYLNIWFWSLIGRIWCYLCWFGQFTDLCPNEMIRFMLKNLMLVCSVHWSLFELIDSWPFVCVFLIRFWCLRLTMVFFFFSFVRAVWKLWIWYRASLSGLGLVFVFWSFRWSIFMASFLNSGV